MVGHDEAHDDHAAADDHLRRRSSAMSGRSPRSLVVRESAHGRGTSARRSQVPPHRYRHRDRHRDLAREHPPPIC